MNEIIQYIAEISQSANNSGLLWLTAFICIILLLLLAWLILRKFRLWYWKVDLQIDTLKNIDEKLKHLGEGPKENTTFINMNNENNETKQTEETTHENKQENEIETKTETEVETQNEERRETVYHKSKTGKIYTEEELEKLIRD